MQESAGLRCNDAPRGGCGGWAAGSSSGATRPPHAAAHPRLLPPPPGAGEGGARRTMIGRPVLCFCRLGMSAAGWFHRYQRQAARCRSEKMKECRKRFRREALLPAGLTPPGRRSSRRAAGSEGHVPAILSSPHRDPQAARELALGERRVARHHLRRAGGHVRREPPGTRAASAPPMGQNKGGPRRRSGAPSPGRARGDRRCAQRRGRGRRCTSRARRRGSGCRRPWRSG